jgi:hypothetical protein
MFVSRGYRIALGCAAVFGLAIYLLIVDLGISAGRIHHGVSVQGIDLGGLTEDEAERVLEKRALSLRERTVRFGREGLPLLRFVPKDLRWRPRYRLTAQAAMEVGREDSPFGAVWDRLRGWFGGVPIEWEGSARAGRVDALLDRWEDVARGRGVRLNRPLLRYKIKRVLKFRPPQTLYQVPLASD